MSDTNVENQLRVVNELNGRIALLEETLLKNELSVAVLRDSENRYRRLFESAKDGILILDADTGRVVDVNPFLLQILGYSYDALTGQHIWELGVFKDIAASKDAFKTLQDNEYIRYDDLPLETIDGHPIAVEFVSNVYLVDSCKVIQCNIRDITARKQAENKLRESYRKIKELNRRLAEMEEAEKRNLATILHDDFGQNLTALSISLNLAKLQVNGQTQEQVVARLDDAISLVEGLGDQLHTIISDLRPTVLDNFGILAALKWYGQQCKLRTGVDVIISGEKFEERLPLQTETIIYRIIQEAVSNAIKHAGTSRVELSVSKERMLRFTISDNGKGFDIDKKSNVGSRSRLGLDIMQERAESIGGSLTVQSAPGRGTKVILEVPFL
jgi:PAS domain S-box-containing protein